MDSLDPDVSTYVTSPVEVVIESVVYVKLDVSQDGKESTVI